MEAGSTPSINRLRKKTHSQSPSQTIPKWPFIAGDALLMLCALWVAIAFSDQLSVTLVAAFTLSILLGVIIFSAPYLMEYWMEQQKTRLHQVKAEETLLNAVEKADDVLRRCKNLEQEVMKGVLVIRQAPQKMEDLSEKLDTLLADAEEKLISPLRQATRSFSPSTIDSLSSQLKEIKSAISEINPRHEQAEVPSVDLNPIEEHILRIEQFLTQNVHAEPPELLQFETTEPENNTKGSENSAIKASSDEDEAEVAETEATAFPGTEDKVSRIEIPTSDAPIDLQKELPEEKIVSSDFKTDLDPIPVSKEPDDSPEEPSPQMDEKLPANLPSDKLTETAELPDQPAKQKTAAKEQDPNPQELLFGDDEESNQSQTEGITRVLVDAFIGVSNKLFIRGDAPGLSWDKGTPMDLVGIGKWEWQSDQVTSPFECRVYINDDPDMNSASFEITPGGVFSTTASF